MARQDRCWLNGVATLTEQAGAATDYARLLSYGQPVR